MNFAAHNPTTVCLVHSNVAAGTTSTVSTDALVYAIRGKMYKTAAKANAATPTTDANNGRAFAPVTAGFGCLIILGVRPDGSLAAYQSSVEKVDATGNFASGPQYTTVPNDFCPIGWVAVRALSNYSGSWVFGSSNNSGGTGLVYSWQPLFTLPDRPLAP